MEFYKNQLCISYTELTAGDPLAVDPLKRPILSESNFKYYKKTGKLQVLNRACYGTPALVLYASLPDSVKQEVEARKGETFETEPKRYVLKEMIRRDPMAEQFFRGWTFEGRPHDHLKPEYVELYVANASALNAVLELTGNRSLFIKQYGKPYNRVWPETSRELNEIQDVVGCRLPKNHLALKRVALKYSEEGYESLISGKMKNNNARKNKESRQEALIVELIGDGRNIDNETVARLYNAVAGRMNWKPITGATVANYRKEHPECYAGRYGKSALANNKLMQVTRTAPTAPMYFWCVDGWDTELFYQAHATDSRGRSVTTYHHRPTVVAIVDPFNKYIIGYAIGRHESAALIRQAFRNAFEHVKELFGSYFKPWQVQTDNYGRGHLKCFYEAVGHWYTPAAVKNAKSKIIEPFFNQFNRQWLRLLPNSSGHGVKSRQKLQVSDDWIETHKRDFPDFEGCCRQLVKMIDFDRATKREEYINRWIDLPETDRQLFAPEDFLLAFGETAAPRPLRGDGVHLQVGGHRFQYECFDKEFRSYGHTTFFLKYDPSDMDRVIAVENIGTQKEPKEGGVRFVLERKYEQPMALKDREEGDAEQLHRVFNFNKEYVDDIVLKRARSGEIVRELFEENEDLSNTLTAHVITDSLGRHKDVRNEVAGRKEPIFLLRVPKQEEITNEEDDFTFSDDHSDFLNDF